MLSSSLGCPYNDRCVFLHDPRLRIEGLKLKASSKNGKIIAAPKDTFYWPDQSVDLNHSSCLTNPPPPSYFITHVLF